MVGEDLWIECKVSNWRCLRTEDDDGVCVCQAAANPIEPGKRVRMWVPLMCQIDFANVTKVEI